MWFAKPGLSKPVPISPRQKLLGGGGQTLNTGLRLLRRNYALLQYNRTNIANCLDLTFRWTQNLDDWSGQLTALASYMLGNHFQLFTVATVNEGGGDTEFKSLLDYQWMIGLEYTL